MQQATRILADLVTHLREEPPLPDALPLLAPLLHQDTGVPILLGDILRNAARVVTQQAANHSMDDDVRQIILGLREAAREITEWHALHWDIQRLNSTFPQASGTLTPH
ncbi:hypothetical protein [Streptomyces sp. NPDC006645]|uniref:hypothetical protein n=1 Tax=unclassified Streptomyces TaxID=2593676 RepID=UPI0033A41A10